MAESRCVNCGVRIAPSHYDPRLSSPWVHVTANSDTIGVYCRIQQATPTPVAAATDTTGAPR